MIINQKVRTSSSAGFTLVEVLTVIAIIAILAAMSMSGYVYYKRITAERATKVFIGRVSLALEDYHRDYSEYPYEGADGGGGSTKILYQKLYGVSDGKSDVPDEGATVYMPDLNPKVKPSLRRVDRKKIGSKYYLVDYFRSKNGNHHFNHLHYRCDPPGSDANTVMNGPGNFDLYSYGYTGNKNITKNWITNW